MFLMRPSLSVWLVVLLLLIVFQVDRQLIISSSINTADADRSCWNATDIPSTTTTAAEDSCRTKLIASLSRIWKIRRRTTFCTEPTDTLSLVKVPKSASSTLAGLLLRLQSKTHCQASWEHGKARDKTRGTWNIAPVRHPDERALSSVYFHHISFHQTMVPSPSLAFLQERLLRISDNYIFDYLRRDMNTDVMTGLANLLETYDMLFVVDRLDESIIVLSILLQLPVSFFLTNSAKQAGSWYHARENRCIRLHSATASVRQMVSEHVFDGTEWQRRHSIDHLLYEIANASLTKTIAYHQEEFDRRSTQYQNYKQQIEVACESQDIFPCSFNGTSQLAVSKENCYLRDFGCGYPCIDSIVES